MNRFHLLIGSSLFGLFFLSACTPQGQAWFWPLEQEETVKVASSSSSKSSERKRVRIASGALKHVAPESKPVVTPDESLTIPVLVYHHVRPHQGWSKATWSWKMTVSPDVFDRHMAWLVEKGYETIDLDTAVAMLRDGEPGPKKPVVITFDDNQLNAYENGLPVMEKYGQIAVWYIVTNRLDQEGVINRERVLDLHERGHDIQSHTVSHAGLTWATPDQVKYQLAESKRVLEELLNKSINHIAYPLTAHNASVRERTRAAGYVTGSIMDPRRATAESDLYKLPRIMMTDDTNLEQVLP